MCETWFMATTQPPVAGIFSPSIHSCLVPVSSTGFTSATAIDQAGPRRSPSLRTLTDMHLSLSSTDRAGRDYSRLWEDSGVTTHPYALLVPVKDGQDAKTRLGAVGDGRRTTLMRAFAR